MPPTAPLGRRARFLAGRSLVELGRLDEAFQTFRGLADERPTAALYNNLGVIQIRRGATPQTGKPTYFFTKATELDPEEADYFFNLGYAYWLEKDAQAAVYWLREAVRRNTVDGDAHFVLGVALQAAGAPAESARELGLARQLSSKYAEWEKKPAGADPVPKALERPSQDIETMHGPQLDAAQLTSAQREQQQLAGLPPRAGPALLRVRARPRRPDRAAQGDLPVALRRRAAPAAGPRAAADGPDQGRGRRPAHRRLEPGFGAWTAGAGRSAAPVGGQGRRPGGGNTGRWPSIRRSPRLKHCSLGSISRKRSVPARRGRTRSREPL